jgi:uncharacterized membrane protein
MRSHGSILLVGEAWTTYSIHLKGFSAFEAGSYGEGAEWLIGALESSGWTVRFIPTPLATRDFPSSENDLAEYDVIVFSDIPADTILLHPDTFERGLRTTDRLASLAAYVRRGGGFLMIGGYMSFSGMGGKARYGASALRDVLPVEMAPGDDRVEVPAGVNPTVVTNHSLLDGIDRDWPYFLGYNQLRAKDGSEVILAVENDPFLVVGTYGRGRVAAFASDCAPHWGSPAFLDWDGYGTFWDQLALWLKNGSSAGDSSRRAESAASNA